MKNIVYFILFLSLISCSKTRKKDTGFIHAGKLSIYFESTGTGPEVLLLHAGLQDHNMWEKQVEVLADSHRTITIDLPGHGKSSGSDTTMLIADVIIKVLDSLQIEKISVIGLSHGSVVATDLVLAYPNRVNKVVLVSPGLTGWDKVLKPDSVSLSYFALVDSAFKKKDNAKTAEMFVRAWFDGPFRKPEQVNKQTRDNVYNTSLGNLQNHHDDSWGKFSKETGAQRAAQIQNHVVIVYAEQDIPFIIDVSHFLHRAISGSKEIRIANVAHMLNLEAEKEFNGLITVFLQ